VVTDGQLSRGLWGVLATPFSEDGRDIDDASLVRQIGHHRTVGSRGLVALGVFGEAARLDMDERLRVVDVVTRHAGGLPVVIGLPELKTAEAVESGKRLLDAATGDRPTLMVQINTPDARPLTRHLTAVHEATGTRIVVQDYPTASNIVISPAQLLTALEEAPFVAAIKSEVAPTSLAIAELTGRAGVPVFGGLGGLGLLDELMAGAAGAMTGFSFPEGIASTLHAWERGGYEAAAEAYRPWLPLVNFEAQVKIGLAIRKWSLRERGIIAHVAVRPPGPQMPERLVPLLHEHIENIENITGIARPAADR
jgi:4-hydroxy-tetrahydrodipicolinate synthase